MAARRGTSRGKPSKRRPTKPGPSGSSGKKTPGRSKRKTGADAKAPEGAKRARRGGARTSARKRSAPGGASGRRGRRAEAAASEAPARRRSVVSSIPVEIGRVVHVYAKAGAAAVALREELLAGDAIAVRGATTDFCALAERLERDGQPVEAGRPGETIGVALPERVRTGDRVFRLTR